MISKINQMAKWKLIVWGVLFLLLALYFVSLYYPDIYITYRYSLTFLDCIKDGKLFDFYQISLESQNELGFAATYFIPIYIIFAVWNFPVWILTRFCGISAEFAGCLLWSKCIIVVFAAASIYVFIQIMKKMSRKKIEFPVFLFVSSLFFVLPSFAMSQYDIIECFFFLCGIYLYMKDEKISWRVWLFFSVAVSVKLMAVFLLFILLLLIEKRLIYIALHTAGSFIITFVTMLPFYANGYRECAETLNQSFVDRLFTSVIPGGISSLSLFWIGFTTVALLAYLLNHKEGVHHIVKHLIWLSVFTFMLFFTFVLCHPQWITLFLPFLILLATEYKENLKINMILEIIAEITLIIVQGIYFYWVYFSETSFESLIFHSKIKYESGLKNLPDLAERFGMSSYIPGVYAVFFVCTAALLILNNPWHPILCRAEETKQIVVERAARIIRIGMIVLYFLITCVIAFL